MATLILTFLPAVVTFAVATWNSPTDDVQPRSAISGCRASH
jgi:hypothetical protein